MREYTINLRDITTFPAISSGVWCEKYHINKHWSWSSWPSCKLQGLSHTFLLLKGWYTWRASRRLFIPEDYFYCGQVVVLLKDSVLEPCSPFRHGVKIKSIFEDSCRPVTNNFLRWRSRSPCYFSFGSAIININFQRKKILTCQLPLELPLVIVGQTLLNVSCLY